MKLLGNFDLFNEYYDIDAKKFYSFETLKKTVGVYKIIGSKMTGLLVENGELFLFNGDDKYLITESNKVLIKEKNKKVNEFILFKGNKELVRFFYPLPDSKLLNISPFEYIDEEDFKWGDFIGNIINNSNRKRNFLEI